MATLGMELMNKINSGEINQASSSRIKEIRSNVSGAIAELLEHGARVRPLTLSGKHIGWIRGIHVSERRNLCRLFTDQSERALQAILLATTFSYDEVADLDSVEFRELIKLILGASDADMSLYPYMPAFVTTSSSEILWSAHGTKLTSYSSKSIQLLGQKEMQVISPPDIAHVWAMLATYREDAKQKLSHAYNAATIAQAMIGRGAQTLFNNLNKYGKQLATDIDDPWKALVKRELLDIDFNDGWAHAGADDSADGLVRELASMQSIDRHEQVMQRFYEDAENRAKRKNEEAEARYQRALSSNTLLVDSARDVSDEEIKRRDKLRHKGIDIASEVAYDADDGVIPIV